jgi:hypothetical protein
MGSVKAKARAANHADHSMQKGTTDHGVGKR